jgi:hypothetical protein
MNESPVELLRRFVHGGFEQLTDAQPAELADYLEKQAAETGQSAPLFISQAIRSVSGLFREHDEYGGTRLGFVLELDNLVRERLPIIQRSEPHWAAKLARDFRDEILARVTAYNPQNTHEE